MSSDVLERGQQLGQEALALGQRQAAGRQRDAGHAVAAQARQAVPMAMPCSLRIASIFAFAFAGTLAMMRFWLAVTTKPPGCTSAISRSAVRKRPAGHILDAAVLDEERQVPLLVGALLPADDVAGRRELERARLAELVAEAPLDLGAEGVEPAVLDRVLEARALAVLAVAPVALHGDDLLGDIDRLLGRAEAEDVGRAREGVVLAVRHAHAAADGDVVADELALLDDGDVAEVVREDVDVVATAARR